MKHKELRPFLYYLECVRYCREHNIPLENIMRRSFREWNIDGVYDVIYD